MIIIGEKINGFVPRTCKAIEEHDEEYIKEIALKQAEAGADYIDCSPATTSGIGDTLEYMEWLVGLIQEVTDTPIALDSPNVDLLLEAMKLCKAPGIINSASLCEGKCDKVFPVIAGTQWGCVIMLDDDVRGIPSDAEGRVDNFKKVLEKAKEYGVKPEQLYFDPLVETLGANEEAFLTFGEVCRQIKATEPRCHITSGLSNISFQMPVRKMINMAFMCLSMQAGMDSAIVDPLNRDMMGIIFATNALLGEDEFCMDYITGYREGCFGPVQQ
ncbi:MAG: methyltetrahydrofolate cobalamin methyltransferase [Eggerthellaceae bacterium]|nr:methyltetrahydrofolate cobalamin methyltransferase [Eggerthellaceae bacterium]